MQKIPRWATSFTKKGCVCLGKQVIKRDHVVCNAPTGTMGWTATGGSIGTIKITQHSLCGLHRPTYKLSVIVLLCMAPLLGWSVLLYWPEKNNANGVDTKFRHLIISTLLKKPLFHSHFSFLGKSNTFPPPPETIFSAFSVYSHQVFPVKFKPLTFSRQLQSGVKETSEPRTPAMNTGENVWK